MTLVRPSTKLIELINAANKEKSISVLVIDADLASGRPPGLLAIAVGYEDIQLLLDAVRPLTDIYGYNQGQVNLKHMFFNVSGKWPGHAPTQILVYAGVLEEAQRTDKILSLIFENWPAQSRPASLVIAASGARHVEKLKEYLIPALQREKKLKQEQPLTGYKDLPIDFIPKGEG